MKTKPRSKVFLLILSAFLLAACERQDDPSLAQADKGMQAARPIEGQNGPYPCDCDPTCQSFGVSRSLEPAGDYAFAVALNQDAPCDKALLTNPKCVFSRERFEISFVFDPLDTSRFDLTDIEEVLAVPNPPPTNPSNAHLYNQVFENLEGTTLSVYGPSILYFKWKQGRVHPAPKLQNIITGGICIIGIITDPCHPCPPIYGRALRPIVPRPFKPD